MTNKEELWSSIQSQLSQAGIGGNFRNKEVADRLNETINEYAEEYYKERLALLDVSKQRELLIAYELKMWINPTQYQIDMAAEIVDIFLSN